jgi:tripartite-type tricarboxylate transporter receptor subunit TctC
MFRVMRTSVTAALAVGLAMMCTIAAAPTAAQSYPQRPIRVIVPLAAGGQTDVVARLIAQKLSETLGQPVVIDNRSGAGGLIGTETAVRANPDGYTLLLAASTYAANAALYKLSYDPMKDVEPIALVGETAFVLSVHPSLPVKSVKELIGYAKSNPGKLNYGSGGAGSTTHLATELFNQMAGTRFVHVPYKGSGPALNALVAGEVQCMVVSMPVAIPQIRTNRIRGLASTAAKRSASLPDLPTVAETITGYEAASWFALFSPRGLPREISVRWNTETNRVLKLPDVIEQMTGLGLEPAGGSSQRLREIVARDIAKWRRVVATGGIKPEN